MPHNELGESSVPYSPVIVDTYLQGKQPFTPSFYEWLSIRGQQLIDAFNGGGSYTVPAGYVFFLNTICLSATGAGANIIIQGVGGNTALTYARAETNITVSYPIPIKIDSEDRLSCNTAGSALAMITGFLIKKDVIPQV